MADVESPPRSSPVDAADGPLDLYAEGRLSLTMAAMRAVLDTRDGAELARAVASARARWGEARLAPLVARLDEGTQAQVRAVAYALDHTYRDVTPEAVLAKIASGFDTAVAVSPDTGVALYCLGDPALLAQVTGGVVAWLKAEGLFRRGEAVLEVGCGSGRFLRALHGETAVMVGVEISAGMAVEAAGRMAHASGVMVVRGSGCDLAFVANASVSLVLYADSFPYVVQASEDLPARMIGETARVLRPGGRAVVLNWSYRGDAARDLCEAEALARRHGLDFRAYGASCFPGWDANTMVLSRPCL